MTQFGQVDKSRLGINSNQSYMSPNNSNLTDFDLLKSQNNNNNNYKQHHAVSIDGDLSSLKVIDSKSPKSGPSNSTNDKSQKKKPKSRPRLKERERENNYYQNGDEDGMGSSLGVTERYEDVIKMFKKESDDRSNNNNNVLLKQELDNDNVNQLDKVKSFAHNYNDQ